MFDLVSYDLIDGVKEYIGNYESKEKSQHFLFNIISSSAKIYKISPEKMPLKQEKLKFYENNFVIFFVVMIIRISGRFWQMRVKNCLTQ